jgi:hypothetical protein
MERQNSSDSTISVNSQQSGHFSPAQQNTASGPSSSSSQSQSSLAVLASITQQQQLDPMTDLSYFDDVTIERDPQTAYQEIKMKDPRRAHYTDVCNGVIRVHFVSVQAARFSRPRDGDGSNT